jgi:molybdate-binding protein
MLNHEQAFEVDLRYVSNQNSLVSLARNDCELAGMHLPQGRLRQASIAASRPWLVPSLHRVVSFVTREMGLMVKRGNPLAVAGLDSLCRPAVRFVNRDPDSGTRILFDQLLTQHGLRSDAINGYARIEFTHAAVAAYVASGMADVAFGVEAAARQFDLDFVRLVTEDYFFVCRKETLGLDPVKRVLTVMRSDAFHAAIAKLPGYKIRDAGAVTTIGDMFRLPQ